MNNRQFGTAGENMAAEILQLQGYRILKRNYRCKMGEIDIVASKGTGITFFEVKSRTTDECGRPCEAVDFRKQERIRKAAECYLQDVSRMGYNPRSIKFDVIEINVNHVENAF